MVCCLTCFLVQATVADRCKRATTAQNTYIRRNALQLKKLCKYKNTNVPKPMQIKEHLHQLDNTCAACQTSKTHSPKHLVMGMF